MYRDFVFTGMLTRGGDLSPWAVLLLSASRFFVALFGAQGRVKTSIGLSLDTKKSYDKDKLFTMLSLMVKNKALIGAGTTGTDQGEATADKGLVRGHA